MAWRLGSGLYEYRIEKKKLREIRTVSGYESSIFIMATFEFGYKHTCCV